MSGDTYPKFRAIAVQAASVFLDRDATIEKMEDLVKEATKRGADLVVFPESFIPAFPVWNIVYPPIEQHNFYRRLFDNAITMTSISLKKISQIAKENKVFLSVGITEKDDISMGAMWNTNLLFNREGQLINRHRKLVPTWAEKLTWANGDASQLTPATTEIGRIGTLICGENTNTLSRYSLLAQGEQVHISTYPPAWPFQYPNDDGKESYDLTNNIKLRAAAHAFEGKVFNIVSSGVLDEDAIEKISLGNAKIESTLRNAPKPVSLIIGPTGDVICEPLVGGEGMVEADIDISESIVMKQAHDIVGYYNRFDIFRLNLNKQSQVPISVKKDDITDELIQKINSDIEESSERLNAEKV